MNISKNEIILKKDAGLSQFAERLSHLLPKLCQSMVRHERNYLTDGTLTLPHLWALELLQENKECTMHDLAEELQLKSSSATVLVDRLEKLGLIRRQRNAQDRRVVHVALAPKGRKVLQQIATQKKKGIIETFKPLSAQERRDYLNLLEKLAGKLSLTRAHSKEK